MTIQKKSDQFILEHLRYNKENLSSLNSSLSLSAIKEIQNLLRFLWNGRLETRINVETVYVKDREILERINLMLDTGIGVLGISAICLDLISNSYI